MHAHYMGLERVYLCSRSMASFENGKLSSGAAALCDLLCLLHIGLMVPSICIGRMQVQLITSIFYSHFHLFPLDRLVDVRYLSISGNICLDFPVKKISILFH